MLHQPCSIYMDAPKAVVFDLGKVLVEFDYMIAVRRLIPRMHLSASQMVQLLQGWQVFRQYECGEIATDAFFARVREITGFDGTPDEFGEMFGDIFTEIPPMIEVHRLVRERGLRTYIFSNTNELAVLHMRKHFPFFSCFDGYVYSYEHRAMKPDPRLYQVLERMAGLAGSELFYLDDRPENVEAALERGWLAVVHDSPAKSREALVRAGVL